MKIARLALLLVPLLLSVAPPADAVQVETWTSHYPLTAGGRVSVENVQGSIWVEAWDRAEVQLMVSKTGVGPNARLDDVEIVVQPSPDWLQVNARHGNSSDTDSVVLVDFRLRVPRQVQLTGLHTVNGNILVRDIEGSVEARTLNGHISQDGVSGSLTARTLNGNVSVALRALPDAPGALELESINGDVTLLLPPQADADLVLSTVAGRIENQTPFTVGAMEGQSAARARLGRGGVSVRLRTIRGDIRVAEREDLL